MTTLRKIGTVLFLCSLSAAVSSAPTKLPPETRNAALRYWMAFAALKDTGADKSLAELITKTLAGDAPWDEAKLGQLLEANQESIEIMQRATKLPDCDWGLEYSLGPETPIPFLGMSARALGRLNLLYGFRAAAKGDTQTAVDTWLAGTRFSHDLAQGQSLLGTLVAANLLRSDLHALEISAKKGALSEVQKKQIENRLRLIPETGFDWGQSMSYEDVNNLALRQLADAANPAALYRKWFGTAPPDNFKAPNASEIAAYNRTMSAITGALRLPPDQAEGKLKAIESSRKSLHPVFQNTIPNLVRINDTRKQIQNDRQSLLNQLSTR